MEQRQRYQEDFSAEYDEYKDLHTRIATITHMFVQLASKIKSMSPGTKEHKVRVPFENRTSSVEEFLAAIFT